ncbi:nucleoside triphosphate pyrophosphohydrolase [Fibrobacterota bacterium]
MKKYSFHDLVSIMEKLRGPDGCPWDREQTNESILRYFMEEVYEYMDAVHLEHAAGMKEELGDILLQVIFQSQMAKQRGLFSVEEVIQAICEKLIRRHPHVFGKTSIENPDEVLEQWEQIKVKEKGKKDRLDLQDIPSGLPPLLKAEKIQRMVRKTGFEWPDYTGPLDKIKEELDELSGELKKRTEGKMDKTGIEEEFGDVLFSLVNLARHLGIDPSGALQKTNLKFTARFERMRGLMEKEGKNLMQEPLEVMEEYWQKAKDIRG